MLGFKCARTLLQSQWINGTKVDTHSRRSVELTVKQRRKNKMPNVREIKQHSLGKTNVHSSSDKHLVWTFSNRTVAGQRMRTHEKRQWKKGYGCKTENVCVKIARSKETNEQTKCIIKKTQLPLGLHRASMASSLFLQSPRPACFTLECHNFNHWYLVIET